LGFRVPFRHGSLARLPSPARVRPASESGGGWLFCQWPACRHQSESGHEPGRLTGMPTQTQCCTHARSNLEQSLMPVAASSSSTLLAMVSDSGVRPPAGRRGWPAVHWQQINTNDVFAFLGQRIAGLTGPGVPSPNSPSLRQLSLGHSESSWLVTV
jgi:hypothetical protein